MCNDKGVGKFTSKDASVVDYVIGSINFLKLVQNFSVLDSSKLFSDIHTPLSLKVTCAEKPNDVIQKDETPGTEKIKQWDNEKLKSFVENIDQVQVNDILSQLTDMGENTINNATVVTVDAVVEKYVICKPILQNLPLVRIPKQNIYVMIQVSLNHGLMMSVGKQGSNLGVRNENLSEIVHKL